MDWNSYVYTLDLQVRDYECDMDAVVNNSVYLNYLEHARHEFLGSVGISFAELTARKIHPVVIRAEVDYKVSLRSGDRFRIGINVEMASRFRLAFVQDIYRTVEGTSRREGGRQSLAAVEPVLAARGRILTAIISETGRPIAPADMHPAMAALLNSGG